MSTSGCFREMSWEEMDHLPQLGVSHSFPVQRSHFIDRLSLANFIFQPLIFTMPFFGGDFEYQQSQLQFPLALKSFCGSCWWEAEWQSHHVKSARPRIWENEFKISVFFFFFFFLISGQESNWKPEDMCKESLHNFHIEFLKTALIKKKKNPAKCCLPSNCLHWWRITFLQGICRCLVTATDSNFIKCEKKKYGEPGEWIHQFYTRCKWPNNSPGEMLSAHRFVKHLCGPIVMICHR